MPTFFYIFIVYGYCFCIAFMCPNLLVYVFFVYILYCIAQECLHRVRIDCLVNRDIYLNFVMYKIAFPISVFFCRHIISTASKFLNCKYLEVSLYRCETLEWSMLYQTNLFIDTLAGFHILYKLSYFIAINIIS